MWFNTAVLLLLIWILNCQIHLLHIFLTIYTVYVWQHLAMSVCCVYSITQGDICYEYTQLIHLLVHTHITHLYIIYVWAGIGQLVPDLNEESIDACVKDLTTAISKALADSTPTRRSALDPRPSIPAPVQDEIRLKNRLRRQWIPL
jgi:hypothetical protein